MDLFPVWRDALTGRRRTDRLSKRLDIPEAVDLDVLAEWVAWDTAGYVGNATLCPPRHPFTGEPLHADVVAMLPHKPSVPPHKAGYVVPGASVAESRAAFFDDMARCALSTIRDHAVEQAPAGLPHHLGQLRMLVQHLARMRAALCGLYVACPDSCLGLAALAWKMMDADAADPERGTTADGVAALERGKGVVRAALSALLKLEAPHVVDAMDEK